jgi:hypothetical protein
MKPRRWHVCAGVLGLLAVAMLTGAAATAGAMPSSSAASAGTMTYTDPAGDAQGGPDVTAATITGDPATSTIKVAVTASGYEPASADGLERDVLVYLDADRNFATGDPDDGTEYGLEAWNDSTGRYWNVTRWNGSKWESIPLSPTMSFTRVGDILTWTVSSSDLGGVTGFRFYVLAGIWSTATSKWTARDDAPDGTAWWDYSLTATDSSSPAPETSLALLLSEPTTTPKQARAGQRFTLSYLVQFEKQGPITSIDLATGEMKTGIATTWTPVPSGKMVGSASVAGRPIAYVQTFKNGDARVSFVLPKTAKGKLLKVKVKITATDKESGKTVTATRTATFRVR